MKNSGGYSKTSIKMVEIMTTGLEIVLPERSNVLHRNIYIKKQSLKSSLKSQSVGFVPHLEDHNNAPVGQYRSLSSGLVIYIT